VEHEPEGDDRETTETSEHYEVARTDDGWGVWDRREPGSPPLAMYRTGDIGFEQAYEHFTKLNRSERSDVRWRAARGTTFWIAIVAGAVWIVANTAYPVALLTEEDEISVGFQTFLGWVGALSQLAYSTFLVSFALNVRLRLGHR
jgi:hypothetical protein